MIIMNTSDRPLKLKLIDGKAPQSTLGVTDRRLYTEGNRIHAVMDDATCLWTIKFEQGAVPAPLQQKFTSFPRLFKFAKGYYFRRNLELTEE